MMKEFNNKTDNISIMKMYMYYSINMIFIHISHTMPHTPSVTWDSNADSAPLKDVHWTMPTTNPWVEHFTCEGCLGNSWIRNTQFSRIWLIISEKRNYAERNDIFSNLVIYLTWNSGDLANKLTKQRFLVARKPLHTSLGVKWKPFL